MRNSMESYLSLGHFDLISPDGTISEITARTEEMLEVIVTIEKISPAFVGFQIDPELIQFNVKSSVAQLGVNGISREIFIDHKKKSAEIKVELVSIGPIAKALLSLLDVGCRIGKLFAADPSRRVRNPEYLHRMFKRRDRDDRPLLSFGGSEETDKFVLEKQGDRTIAHLKLKRGVIRYDEAIMGFLPTLAYALKSPLIKPRKLLKLHQKWDKGAKKTVTPDDILLVRTLPLHIRTAFARVVQELLPKGIQHTTASILQPDTLASGDVYELYGQSAEEINSIPLEFFTLEPHREHVFFIDRDQLQTSLEDSSAIFRAFDTAPPGHSAVFIVKGEQMLNLKSSDWIYRDMKTEKFPGLFDLSRQGKMVQDYIEEQPSYPFLKAIEKGHITSQGVLFSRYFPSPLMKKMLLGDSVQSSLKGIYFQYPSHCHGQYFSHEDRTTLIDLAKFAIPVFWADQDCGKVLQYAPKPEKDIGMFVPIEAVDTFIQSTAFGVYGSTLIALDFEEELAAILKGVLEMKQGAQHPLLNPGTPISLITGGGPGVMEVGNRVARKLNILSCANIVDFRGVEQEQNPYIDAKMTYRVDRLVERQGEFNLDFPIFLKGGFGTDFELSLEEVRRKVEIKEPTPALLLGSPEYWREKITPRFQANLSAGTIRGSEWVSNCFYCVETAKQALHVYQKYLDGNLPIGPKAPSSDLGFILVTDETI